MLKYLSDQYGFTESDLEQSKPKTILCNNLKNDSNNEQQNISSNQINLVITLEPIKQWTSIPGIDASTNTTTNLLRQMYLNSNRWAFTFEHYAQFTRFEQMKRVCDQHIYNYNQQQTNIYNTLHLIERSIFSNRFCFVENFFRRYII